MDRAQTLGFALGLIALDLIVYGGLRHHGYFTFDDPGYVSENVHVLGGISASNIAWAFTTGAMANWHPVTWLSHMLDIQMFGANAGAQHLVSVAIHVANTLLLFWFFRTTTGAIGKSALVAALFAVHPLHVESVAWISERKDVLSTFFLFLTLLAYVRYVRKRSMSSYAGALALFALGLMSKPMLVTLPIMLLLVDVWPLGRVTLGPSSAPHAHDRAAWAHLLIEKAPFVVFAIASSVITFVVQRHGGAVNSFGELPAGVRVANAIVSYGRYVTKTIWPARLAVFYPYDASIPAWKVVSAGVALVAITAFVCRAATRAPYLVVGWLWFVVMLLPVIGFVQVGTQAIADRYMYVPIVGLFVMAAWGASALIRRIRVPLLVPVISAAIVAALTLTARAQAESWGDNLILWQRTASATTGNYRAETSIGALLAGQGHIEEAIPRLIEALRIAPGFPSAAYNLGLIRVSQGRTAEAEQLFSDAIRTNPDYAEAHNKLAGALLSDGKVDAAIAEASAALRLSPAMSEPHGTLGAALVSQGKIDEGMREFQAAIRADPKAAAPHLQLGIALAGRGKVDDAIVEYQTALRLNPQFAEAENALGFAAYGQGHIEQAIAHYLEAVRLNPNLVAAQENLGFILAANGRVGDAVPHLQAAVRLIPQSAPAHNYLAMALGGAGRFAEAAAEFREVLRLDPNNVHARQALAALAKRGGTSYD